jgi:hypothetical protein
MNAKRRFLTGLLVAGACMALTLAVWKLIGARKHSAGRTAKPPVAMVSPVADEFDRMLAVLTHGGPALELEHAIGFLDTATRIRKQLTEGERAALLAALEHGTPAKMADGSWSHIFNSACNVLAVAQTAPDAAFLRLLERVAVDDARLVMRLYALQHIGCNYATASSADQQRLRALVQRLLADPASKTAGTALVLWRSWEKTAGPGETPSLDLSRAMVTDKGRAVDVRVTALHAIGGKPTVLELARAIAPDRSQPLLLRKAALNLIGRHGTEQDLTILHLCSRENPRLSQAGDPAARVLQDRLAGILQPALQPY